jgi:hypothetical protein
MLAALELDLSSPSDGVAVFDAHAPMWLEALDDAEPTEQSRAMAAWITSAWWLLSMANQVDLEEEPRANSSGEPSLREAVLSSLFHGTGLSAVRMADGEGRALALWWDTTPQLARLHLPDVAKAAAQRHGAEKWLDWFGVGPQVTDPRFATFGAGLVGVMESVDALGLRPSRALATALRRWAETGAGADTLAGELTVRVVAPPPSSVARFAMTVIPRWNADGTLGHLVTSAERVVLVTGYREAANYLASRCRRRIDLVEIPVEQKPLVPRGLRERATPGEHLAALEDWSSRIVQDPLEGTLVLSAAGPLGKPVAVDVARRGGVCLDIGATVDGWLGLATRPRLIDGPPHLTMSD